MGGILELLSLILQITFAGFAMFVILHIMRGMKKRTLRDEISKIEAKMAAFRINLKSRVKKKAKRFKATYPQNITLGDPIDVCITQLSELTFERNNDFQEYIELCKKINVYIDLANVEKVVDPSSMQPPTAEADFMGADFKNEIYIVRLINDMVMVSRALNKQIGRYNHFDKRAKMHASEPISFPSFFELQKVFKNGSFGDENTHPGADSESAKSA